MRGLTALLTVALTAGTAWAQQTRPAEEPSDAPHVKSVRLGFEIGMCYGYCQRELKVERGAAVLVASSRERDKRKCPDQVVRSDFSDQHWKELVALVDRDELFAAPETSWCSSCTNDIVRVIEVHFTDRNWKAIVYSGAPPKVIRPLSEELLKLEQKLSEEIPPTTAARCQV